MRKTRTRPSGIEAAYTEHAGSLTRFLRRFLDSTEEIEDVLQDAFLKTYEAERRTHIDMPSAFLYKTARNLALNVISLRRRRRTEAVADIDELSVLYDLQQISDLDPAAQNLIEERFGQAVAAIDQLTPRVKQVFVLRKIYGMSRKEISERLGISVSTIEKHLVRGVVQMKEHRDRQE